MELDKLEKRIDKLEKDLQEANKQIQCLIRYREHVEAENDPFNGYF